LIVVLCGPIKAWWDEWGSQRHQEYTAWRDALSDALVDAGHLVYRPHEGFKGKWTEAAQRVNDVAIEVADVVLNLTPPGVPSDGTDAEMLHARWLARQVFNAPPPPRHACRIATLLEALRAYEVARKRFSDALGS